MNKCPQCSTEFSADTAGGLCPACLLRQGLESQAGPTVGPEIDSSFGSSLDHEAGQSISPEQLMAFLPQFDQIELIGRGGMGMVYKARQKNLDRFVALKVLSPEVAGAQGFAERFAREARAMARLNHPNIVAVYDFGSVEHAGSNLFYLTMELVDGSNLRGLLKQLSPAEALTIVPQICEALQYAHDIGVVHRDIKPENILVDKRGRVRIADFGLAKLLQQARSPSDYTLTRPDLVMGTPSYMAPEQLERPAEVDHRSDLYSLGVVFYEMLTGQLPKGRFPLPSQKVQIDVRLDEVVLKALEHDRELRYQHASEVRTSVESVRNTPAQQPVEAAPEILVPPATDQASAKDVQSADPPAPPRRLSRVAIIASLFLVAGLVGLVVDGLMAIENVASKSNQFGNPSYEQNWVVIIFVLIVGVGLAGVATTLLGAIAVTRIRRAPEKFYGLRLALFDALVFPLLLLDVAVVGSVEVMLSAHYATGNGGVSMTLAPVFFLLPLAAIPADVLIYWWLWKKLRVVTPHARRISETPVQPAAPKVPAISVTPPEPSEREPSRFYAKAFALYVLGWIAFLLLWNLGWPGFIISVEIFAFVAWFQAKHLQKFRPEIVAAREAAPWRVKALRPSNFNAAFTLAFLLLLLGVGLFGDSFDNADVAKIFSDPTMTDISRDFLKNFQGANPKSLSVDVRDLSLNRAYSLFPLGWSHSGPENFPLLSALLVPPQATPSQTISLVSQMFLYPSAIPPEFRQLPHFLLSTMLGLYFFIAGFADMLSSKRYRFSSLAWKPAFSLAALLVLSYLAVASCSSIVFGIIRSHDVQHGQTLGRSTEFQILSEPQRIDDRLFPALGRWASAHGYEIAALTKGDLNDEHRFPPVPTHVTYQAAILWKPGLFDRLGMNRQGMYSRAPEMLVQSASGESGSYTWVTLPVWSVCKAENDAGNALQKDLYSAVKQVLATTQPAQNAPADTSMALPPSDNSKSGIVGFWRSVKPVSAPGAAAPAIQVLWFAQDGNARVGTVRRTENGKLDQSRIIFTDSDGKPAETVAFKLFADHLVLIPADSDPRQPAVPIINFNRLPVSAKEIAINGYWRGLPARTGAPARLGDGAVTLYFDPQCVATEDVDVDIPSLAMKYSVEQSGGLTDFKLHYQIGNGTASLAQASMNSPNTELTLTNFSANDGATTVYERDTLGIDAAPEYSSTPIKPGETPKSDRQRFFDIGRQIVGVYTSPGSAAEGEQMANEALRLADKFPDEVFTPDALNQAHTVLGLVALKKGDLFAAKLNLMQSISDRPSGIMNSFGPQLMLAGALLARDEKQAVLDFLDQSARDYPGVAETMHRRRDLIAAGQTPHELIYHDPSEPLFGRWISNKQILYTLAILTFNPDGTATYAQGYRLHGQFEVTKDKLSVTDAETKKVTDLGAFSIDHDKLTFASWNSDVKNSSYTDGKQLIYRRIGAGDGLVGTWSGKVHMNDAGDSDYTLTVGADRSITLFEEVRMENLQYRYSLDGKKLSYTLTMQGKTREAAGTAVFDGDELVLTGFPISEMGEFRLKRDKAGVKGD